MMKTKFGRTNLEVNKDAFGVLPLQRTPLHDAVKILQKALDGGINFFDTARVYTDSEEKIGTALSSRRKEFVLATKSISANGKDMTNDLHVSLEKLKTDYIDIYQFHNPSFVPMPGDESGLYDAALEAKAQGKIRFIGISNHKISLAKAAMESGLYDTIQFPFSYLSSEEDIQFTKLCAENNVGFIAMKALSGGLLNDIFIAQAWMNQHANVVPIWGIEKESELDQLLQAIKQPVTLDADQYARIEKDRSELGGEFCRGCGYCMPCPVDIPINQVARLSFLINRSPSARFATPEFQKIMTRADDCMHCGYCSAHCPYGLDTPALVEKNSQWYKDFMAARQSG